MKIEVESNSYTKIIDVPLETGGWITGERLASEYMLFKELVNTIDLGVAITKLRIAGKRHNRTQKQLAREEKALRKLYYTLSNEFSY